MTVTCAACPAAIQMPAGWTFRANAHDGFVVNADCPGCGASLCVAADGSVFLRGAKKQEPSFGHKFLTQQAQIRWGPTEAHTMRVYEHLFPKTKDET